MIKLNLVFNYQNVVIMPTSKRKI